MDIICSEKRTVFWECSSRKTESVEEQITSKDKYLSINYFRTKWRLLCLVSFKYFLQLSKFWKLGNICQIFPSFRLGIFSHMTHLDQSHEDKNIWWIIIDQKYHTFSRNLLFLFSPYRCRYLKHLRQWLTTFPKTPWTLICQQQSIKFSSLFLLFEIVVKKSLSCFRYYLLTNILAESDFKYSS